MGTEEIKNPTILPKYRMLKQIDKLEYSFEWRTLTTDGRITTIIVLIKKRMMSMTKKLDTRFVSETLVIDEWPMYVTPF